MSDLLLLELNYNWNKERKKLSNNFYTKCLYLFQKLFICLYNVKEKSNKKFHITEYTLERCLNILQYIIPDKKFIKVMLF